jgi:hypothetical protein
MGEEANIMKDGAVDCNCSLVLKLMGINIRDSHANTPLKGFCA